MNADTREIFGDPYNSSICGIVKLYLYLSIFIARGRCEITYLANAKSVLSRALFNRAFAFSLYREIIQLGL